MGVVFDAQRGRYIGSQRVQAGAARTTCVAVRWDVSG